MQPGELIETYLSLLGLVNSVWEIWLAATFAFVAAIHLGREVLNRFFVGMLVSLYLSMALIMFIRYINFLMMMGDVLGRLESSGIDPLNQPGRFEILLLSVFVWVFGSIGATVFAFWTLRRGRDLT